MRAKLRRLDAGFPAHADEDRYGFRCPGCGGFHQIPTAGPRAWEFNGDVINPTFKPSILVSGVVPLTDEQYRGVMDGSYKHTPVPYICHSFVTLGYIQFLSDCTHALAGQTVPLLEID